MVRTHLLPFLLLLLLPASALAGQPPAADSGQHLFRWIHASSDPKLWEQVLAAFNDELAPDQPEPGQNELDVYRYKYIQKVGIVDQSALVIIGRRPAKEVAEGKEWDEYSSAYNLNLSTLKKSSIQHAEVLWKWKFVRIAKFGPSPVPDVTFSYLTCTECEPAFMFSSLFFDPGSSGWKIRSWGDGEDPWWTTPKGLVVDLDLIGADETFSYECVYGIVNSRLEGFQDLVIRCKEITLKDVGRAKVQDTTLLYGFTDGQLGPRRVSDPSEALGLTAKVCKPGMKTWLCRLPGYMTATSGQSDALDAMFPKAGPALRDLAHFRSLSKGMTMADVVKQCGIPDELGGSGINIFIYHLDDDSVVAFGATDITTPLLYANRMTSDGESAPLFPAD